MAAAILRVSSCPLQWGYCAVIQSIKESVDSVPAVLKFSRVLYFAVK
jgi:hypothetical protein